MRKRTSRIYPDGITECNEVYAPFSDGWQYCDAIYKCDENGVMTCLWEKLAAETLIGGMTGAKIFITWKNRLYAFAKVYNASTGIVVHEGDFIEYDYQTGKWYVISQMGTMPLETDDMRMTEQGLLSFNGESASFLSFDGKKYTLPSSDIEFYAYAAKGNRAKQVCTNKGYLTNNGLNYYSPSSSTIIADYKGKYDITYSTYDEEDGYVYATAWAIIGGMVDTTKDRLLKIKIEDDRVTSQVIASIDANVNAYPRYNMAGFFTDGEHYYPLGSVSYSGGWKYVVYEKNSTTPKFESDYQLVAVSPDEKNFAFFAEKSGRFYVKIGIDGTDIAVNENILSNRNYDNRFFHFVEDESYDGIDENDKKYDLYYFTTKLTGTDPGDINTGMIYER